ncbi:kinase-like protein [Phlyctochytrium arcticum]|nr:kinase-like protein [Phlyctochytrium arcticum]
MGNACRKSEVRPETGYRKVTLNDFTIQRAIGKGAFGKVSIIQKKKGGQFYALKYINKAKCIQEKAVHHMIQERNLLEEIKHPFICNLRYSFQDADNLYMALDLMTGGDLRFHLGRPMKEAASKTILAEISSAIAFLHARNIVHRDVKPDNILLDEHGHAYLTDFNIAVKFRLEKPLKSVAGTEPYMAPELLNGAGYFSSVDWWSLGVMAYELLLGERPFRGKHKRELIKKGEWKFPPQPASNEALSINTSVSAGGMATTTSARRPNRFPRLSETSTSFISGLMTMDVNSRLGCGEEGQVCLMTHPFFEDLSWEKLERKEIPPVFVPAKNKSNFDATHDLEEILLNESPLGGKTKKGKESGQLSPEMVTIEKQFLVRSAPPFLS